MRLLFGRVEADVMDACVTYLRISAYSYPALAVYNAGDVRFTTLVSLFTTIGVRLVFSMIFGIAMHMGVMGIAWAMCLDWTIRGVIFILRQRSGKWKTFRVI